MRITASGMAHVIYVKQNFNWISRQEKDANLDMSIRSYDSGGVLTNQKNKSNNGFQTSVQEPANYALGNLYK